MCGSGNIENINRVKKEVEEAYWFGPISACVHGWVTL